MIMMMMMMMTMMTYTIPYRRTKTHIWDKVLMGIWVHPMAMVKMTMLVKMMMMMVPEEKEDNVEGSMEQGQ